MSIRKTGRYAAFVLAVGMLLGACTGNAGGTLPEDTKTWEGTELAGAGATENGNTGISGSEGTGIAGSGDAGQAESGQPEEERTVKLLHPLINHQYRNYYNDSGDLIETAEWESIEFEGDEAGAYPALAAAVREKFSGDEERLFHSLEVGRKDFEAYLEERSWGGYFIFERTVKPYRCDSEVFSFTVLDYEYTGGAHGLYGYGGYNYDVRTGKLLTVDDMFTDREELAKAIGETLVSQYSPDDFFDVDGLLDSVRDRIDNDYLNIVLTNRGPRVIFNPYEIAAYPNGVMIADLYPEKYPGLVKPEYARTAESWIVKLPDNETLCVDVDGDGLPEDISYQVQYEYEEEHLAAEIVGFDIYAGDRQLFVSADAYSAEGYFVRDQGRSFLYLMLVSDNDYQILYVIDCADKKLTFEDEVCRLNAAAAVKDWDYNYDDPLMMQGYQRSYCLTDPENMYLASKTDYLSTASGNRMMHADEVGVPIPNEGYEYYRIEGSVLDFAALQDVVGTLVDEAGNERGDYVIRAGDSVRYIRTDNETFGDVRTEDGKIVRIRMNRREWPYTVNGIEFEDLFDGILFAG